MAARGRAIRAGLKVMHERAHAGVACGINGCHGPCRVLRIDGLCVAVCWRCAGDLSARGGLRLEEVAAMFRYAVTMDDPKDEDPLGGAGM